MKTKKITIAEVEYTAFTLAKKLMTYNEPIPEFGTRFPNVLESCLETPFGRFNRKDLYRGLISKSAILFYLMIKNHPFQNGNKRIAVVTLLFFLSNNKKWLTMGKEDLYNFAKYVAGSKPTKREKVIFEIQLTLKNYLTNF